ncbi:type I restriction endonuclease subunit R [uncultured Duncaniella sp.]|uniref:type I restriction endonuclease subunit R n=1 Tax=uncultured Duncaniella sp. TaxID=2768039 RepID=UPI0026744DB6|nr:type I restriction endonuclease [uncultured Duncaniella sp.]
MSQHTDTSENGFEKLIEKALVGSTIEERKALGIGMTEEAADAQQPEVDKFYWGLPKDFHKREAVDNRRLWSFLEATQADLLAEWQGRGDMRERIEKEIKRKIETVGILDVLRKGIEVDNLQGTKRLHLFYPRPSEADSAESHRLYGLNQFSVTRQAVYSLTYPGNELDLVLFVNGLPIFTFELKNPWTRQTAKYNGIKQYREDRDPKDPIFMYGRCLAHFAVDKDEIYFCTRLQGKKSFFMPFNQGLPDGKGAGNPVNPNGHKTSYLWERILRKDVIADLISNFAMFDYGETKSKKVITHILKNAKKLIFPRYHQLDVVNRLLDEVGTTGVGGKYLIQHSAGSGKSNSIAWLALRLIKATPATMDAARAIALDRQLFQTVIIVTDRKLLDAQLTANVKAFAGGKSIVTHADTSEQLRFAIESGKRVILTTIQKFPYIVDDIRDMSGSNFDVIIDEAHSSQSGIAADKLNATTYRDPDQNGADTDDLIERLIQERKMSPNSSYFAFTATPKPETLERFGIPKPEGGFRPFHLYSMKQAIEEEFIRDVLTNYTTYHSFYECINNTAENPEYSESRAQKKLRKMVEREPHTISAKADVMLSHFDAKVFRSRRLAGKAKAMVVTKDIECAIRYYFALRRLAEQRHLPYNILIAFSGSKTVDGIEYTEAGLNGFPESNTAKEFEKTENRILVVANKYLTGFDQELLCTMYIDKPLAGVLAVQTLSRLNRISPENGKRNEDILVLDFYNTVENMRDSFNDFYTLTSLSDATDPNVLSDIREYLLDVGVFSDEEVDEVFRLYHAGADQQQLSPILDAAQHRFDNDIEWGENGQAEFKMRCKQFVKVYSRIAALMSFDAPTWEKLYWYLRLLIPQLHIPGNGGSESDDLHDHVDLNTYGLARTALNVHVELNDEETTLDPLAPKMVTAGGDEDDRTTLDIIIQHFNERHMNGWDATPDEQRTKVLRIAQIVRSAAQFNSTVVGNPDTEAANRMFEQILNRAMAQQRNSDLSLYRQYRADETFRHDFANLVRAAIEDGDLLSALPYTITNEPNASYAAEP